MTSLVHHVFADKGRRSTMEDTHVCEPDFISKADGGGHSAALFAVFDGHNGVEVAEYLRTHFAKTLREQLLKLLPFDKVPNVNKALGVTFAKLNDDMRVLREAARKKKESATTTGKLSVYEAVKKYEFEDAGSTAVVALVIDNQLLVVANIGDAEAIVWHRQADREPETRINQEKAKRQVGTELRKFNEKTRNALSETLCFKGDVSVATTLHLPQLETLRIVIAGGKVIEKRINGVLAVSRAFGDFAYCNEKTGESFVLVEPHLYSCRLELGDMVVLACDGLWETMSHNCAAFVALDVALNNAAAAPAAMQENIAQVLVESAVKRQSSDNVSAIVLCVQDEATAAKAASASTPTTATTANDTPKPIANYGNIPKGEAAATATPSVDQENGHDTAAVAAAAAAAAAAPASTSSRKSVTELDSASNPKVVLQHASIIYNALPSSPPLKSSNGNLK